MIAVVEWNRRRRESLPSVVRGRRHLLAAFPRNFRGRFSPCVRELNSDRNVRPAADALESAAHRVFVPVRPQSGVSVADPPLGENRRRLDGEKPGT
jgi:hypothetical protein